MRKLCIFLSRQQDGVQNHNRNICNKIISKCVRVQIFGKDTDKSKVHEAMKSALNSGNACYYQAQNLIQFLC
jgi:hypothetical protein